MRYTIYLNVMLPNDTAEKNCQIDVATCEYDREAGIVLFSLDEEAGVVGMFKMEDVKYVLPKE